MHESYLKTCHGNNRISCILLCVSNKHLGSIDVIVLGTGQCEHLSCGNGRCVLDFGTRARCVCARGLRFNGRTCVNLGMTVSVYNIIYVCSFMCITKCTITT